MSFPRRQLFQSLLLLVLAHAALAADSASLTIDQPSPDSRTFITATVAANILCDSQAPLVTIAGSKILIDAHRCLSSTNPAVLASNIGMLPGGVYDVVGLGLVSGQDVHTRLVVRDVDPFRVIPPGGTTAGGTEIQVWTGTPDPQPMGSNFSVTVDGQPTTTVTYAGFTAFKTPPHAAGDVDVVVSVFVANPLQPYTDRFTLHAAYRYFDPAAAPDPFLFERVLFPIKFEGAGAYGTQWTTDSAVGVSWMMPPLFVEFWRPPCTACPARMDMKAATSRVPTYHLDKGNSASGTVLYAFRSATDALRTSSKIRDLSRQAQSAGVAVPVAFDHDFKRVLDLLDIPVDPRFRATLRVWSLQGSGTSTCVLYGSRDVIVPLTYSPPSVDALAFASVDLTSYLAQMPSGSSASLQIVKGASDRFWAMVSITNNETQEVTVLTPQ